MKNIINAIKVSLTLIAILVVFSVAGKASASFNTDPQDCPTIGVANFTQNIGFSNVCWPTSVNANPGDTINVRVYYHNTGTTPAPATITMSPVSNGSQSTFVFSGNVSGSSGSATVNISGSQSLTIGTTMWYPNQTFIDTPIPGGQNGNKMFTGSLSLGNINPGWSTQGSLVTDFRISTTTVAPTTYQCNDGQDNDGDGLTDYPQDLGCTSPTDNLEYNFVVPVTYQCSNGYDDDLDGLVDYPQDPGCSSPTDNTEYNYVSPITYQCNDGMDNDSDGLVDYPQDPGCTSSVDNTEHNYVAPVTYQCNDGMDNDGDGLTDYPQDPGCTSSIDNTEYNYVAPITYQCNDGMDNDSDGLVDYPQDPGCSSYVDNAEYNYVAPPVYPPTPTVPKTTYVTVYSNTGNGNSHISLKVDSAYKNVCIGDTNNYTITYKNISGKTLNNATLRIELPQEVTFKRSSDGRFNQTDNTLTIQIGTLIKNQEGSINLEGIIVRPRGNDTLLVVTATMVYTNGNSQENAIAYGLSDMSQCLSSNQTAASFFGFGLFPTTLWGWLLLLLLILLIVFLARRYATKTTTKTTTTSTSM